MKIRKLIWGGVVLLIVAVGLGYAGLWMEQGGQKKEGDYTRNMNHIYTLAPGVETRGSSYTIPPALADAGAHES